MDKLPPRVEAFLGRLLSSQRGRDAKLLTRSSPSTSTQPPTISLTSPLGPSPTSLPQEYTPLGNNTFPPLSWSLPDSLDSAQIDSYLLIVEDPDAPLPSPIVHGLYYNIPATKTSISAEDFLPTDGEGSGNDLAGGFQYGVNWHKNVWSGPRPVLGHGEHRYFFQLLALGSPLGGEKKAITKAQIIQELAGDNVLAWGEWIGTFERKP